MFNLLNRFLLALISALLLWAAFPPLNWWPLAWVALAPLFLVLDRVSSKRSAFGWAYFSGLLFFLITLFWIQFVTWPGLILLCGYLALYFGLFGVVYFKQAELFPSVSFRSWVLCVSASAVWVLLEYIRSIAFTGFGWASLAHTQADFKGLIFLSSFTGLAGVSFCIAAVNFIFKDVFFRRAKEPAFLVWFFAGLFVLAGINSMPFKHSLPLSGEIKVAVIQPNTTLAESGDPHLVDVLVQRSLDLSRQALAERPALIVWPETSFPSFVWERQDLLDEIKTFARVNRVYMLFGAVTRQGQQYFNSAILIGSSGDVAGIRSKRHLVLFGEYIPFRKQFPFLQDIVPIDDFTPGDQDAMFNVPGLGKFGVLICFEDTIPEISRRYTAGGAGFLVNLTNDAWFRDSGQPGQHLRNALFRTVENGRPMIRATNTGESCVIGADGRELGCVENSAGRRVQTRGFVVTSIYREANMTLFTHNDEWFLWGCVVFLLGALFYRLRHRVAVKIPQQIKILLIDDEKTAHVLLKAVLGSRGFEVVSAMNGEEGLAMAVSEKPDIILLDVIMPTIKGREVCRRLKKDANTSSIPVIFLTAKNSDDEYKAEMALGAAGHVTKPINSAMLLKMIKKFTGA